MANWKPLKKDLFRELAAAKTAAQLRSFMDAYRLKGPRKWRLEQKRLKTVLRYIDEIPERVRRLKEAPRPNLSHLSEGRRRVIEQAWARENDSHQLEQVNAGLSHLIGFELRRTAYVGLSPDLRRLEFRPHGLAGMLWMQVVESVQDMAKQRPDKRCKQCGGIFVPKRSDARFCSARCRVAAHYKRT